jgi:hypothetical protein
MAFLAFALYSALCFWVVFMDGADILEGGKSFFLFGGFAASLTAREIRFYAGISWLASLAILLFASLGGG